MQPLYPDDPFVIALATDDPAALPVTTARPVLTMSEPAAIARFLIDTGERCEYRPESHA
jgi:molybdopterin-guanine dinucleotide biosynthesis adapter protein